MRWNGHGWLLVILTLALSGCEVVEDQLNDVPPPEPPQAAPAEPVSEPSSEPSDPAAAGAADPAAGGATEPAAGETTEPAAGETTQPAAEKSPGVPPPGEPAAGGDDILGAVAGAAEAATGQGDQTDTGAEAIETVELGQAVAEAGRESVKSSLLEAERIEARAAAVAEQADRQRRRQQHLANAKRHAEYLGLRIQEQDIELASLQVALLAASLDGVRSQGGPGPAADELSFALGALYDLVTINQSQDTAVANAMVHLDAALALLPAPGPAATADTTLKPGEQQPAAPETAAPANAGEDPASSPEAIAREVVAIKGLFDAGQKRTGRDRLQALVLALADDPVEALLDLADAARDRLSQAVGRRGWARASEQLKRVNDLLAELSTAVGEPSQVAAAAPAARSSAPAGESPSRSSGGGLVRLGDDERGKGTGGAAAGANGEEQKR